MIDPLDSIRSVCIRCSYTVYTKTYTYTLAATRVESLVVPGPMQEVKTSDLKTQALPKVNFKIAPVEQNFSAVLLRTFGCETPPW